MALPFFGIGMKTDLFQSCGHCSVFQICWHFIYVVKQSPRAKEKIHESLGAGVIWVTSDPEVTRVIPAFIQHLEALSTAE